MTGEKIGRYSLLSLLGRGPLGSTWLARDPVLDRSVVLKVIPRHLAGPEMRERLSRQARLASRFDHPGIATVYEAGEEADCVYVAFEHVDGESVAARLERDGPLPVDEALRIAREVAAALHHLHSRDMLHGGITASTVLIDRSGRAKIVLPEEEAPEATTASAPPRIEPGRLPPEVMRGEESDRRSDLYQLGVLFYEMLTGHLPFERDRADALLYAVVHEHPVPPRRHSPDLPPEVEAIVLRALAKDPARRFADAEKLIRALENAVPARGNRKGPQRRRLSRRAALVAGSVIAAAAIVYLVWPRPRHPHFDSVAVLPLSLPGENAEEIAYLATGLGDALAGRLSRVSGLRVTPWVTSRRYPPGELPLPDIAAELDVESLVVGSFREEGDRIHVVLSLRRADAHVPSWAAEFEDSRLGLLELQGVITLAVASSLRDLTAEEESLLVRRPTDRTEAWDQYLRGAAALQTGTREGSGEALARFENALAIDPRLAEAWVGVGAAQNGRYWRGWAGNESVTLAEDAFRHALEIAPDMWPAIRGLILVSWDRGPNEGCLRIAADVQRRSSAQGQASVEALLTQALGLSLGGLHDAAVPLLQVAGTLDPANRESRFYLCMTQTTGGDPDAAISNGEEFLRTFGEDPDVHFWLASAHRCRGDREAALSHYERCLELSPAATNVHVHGDAAQLYRELGDERRALEVARDGIRQLESRLSEVGENHRLEAALIRLYAIARDTTKVLELGRRLKERDDPSWSALPWYVAFAYAEIGEEEEANGVLVDQLERLRRPGRDDSQDVVVFHDDWLRMCSEGIGGAGLEAGAFRRLQQLPAFDDLVDALRAEEIRRRALYGGGG